MENESVATSAGHGSKLSLDQRAKARKLYLAGGLTLQEISEKTGISRNTISAWVTAEGWSDDRKALDDKLMRQAEDEVLSLIESNKLDTLKRHLDASRLIEQRIIDDLSRKNVKGEPAYISPRDLAVLAKALKDASDVSGRAVGLQQDGNVLKLPANTMLVPVGLRPRRIKTIEVSAVDEPEPF